MNVANHKRCGEREHIIASLQVVVVVGKTSSTEILLAQLVSLNHRSHGAIEQENAVGWDFFGFAGITRITR